MLFPSITEEPLPYAVVESMALGTIPIASRVGGVPEILEGTYAERIMFTPGNINEFVEKINEVLSLSTKQLIDIGADLREKAYKKFDKDHLERQLLEIFR